MGTILIAYATVEGQTAKLAEHIAATVQRLGYDTECASMDDIEATLDPDRYRAVIAGGSVHEGCFSQRLTAWLKRNQDTLNRLPSASFTVCLDIVSPDPDERARAAQYGATLLADSGWSPAVSWVFAGALRYTQYSWLKRALTPRAATGSESEAEAVADVEYTDWAEVEDVVKRFIRQLAAGDSADGLDTLVGDQQTPAVASGFAAAAGLIEAVPDSELAADEVDDGAAYDAFDRYGRERVSDDDQDDDGREGFSDEDHEEPNGDPFVTVDDRELEEIPDDRDEFGDDDDEESDLEAVQSNSERS